MQPWPFELVRMLLTLAEEGIPKVRVIWTNDGLQHTPVLQPVTAEMLNAGQPARPGRVPKKELCGR